MVKWCSLRFTFQQSLEPAINQRQPPLWLNSFDPQPVDCPPGVILNIQVCSVHQCTLYQTTNINEPSTCIWLMYTKPRIIDALPYPSLNSHCPTRTSTKNAGYWHRENRNILAYCQHYQPFGTRGCVILHIFVILGNFLDQKKRERERARKGTLIFC